MIRASCSLKHPRKVLFLLFGVISCSHVIQEKSSLTPEQLQNSAYPKCGMAADSLQGPVTLKAGHYEHQWYIDPTDTTLKAYYSMDLGDQYAIGDLNGDGVKDAVVSIAESGGGSGVFVTLIAVIDSSGEPLPTAMFTLGDRVDVDTIYFDSGLVKLRISGWFLGDSIGSYSLRYDTTTREFVDMNR